MAKNKTVGVVGEFGRGFRYPFSSISFIKGHPGLWAYVLVPFILNVLLFSGVFYFGFTYFQDMLANQVPAGGAWYMFILHYLLVVLAFLAGLVLVFFTFSAVGALISSPFNDILSEKTERIITEDEREELFSLRGFLDDSLLIFKNQLKSVGLFAGGMLLLFALNLVPGVGPLLYAILSAGWIAFFLVVEYTGYIVARRRLSFREHRRLIAGRSMMMAGLGLALLLILAVPLLQFVMIPLGVVAGTRVVLEEGCLPE